MGFRFSGTREMVNRLLFMDDLKLYGGDEEELHRLVGIAHECSVDIGMRFGLDKCGVLVIEEEVKKESDKKKKEENI